MKKGVIMITTLVLMLALSFCLVACGGNSGGAANKVNLVEKYNEFKTKADLSDSTLSYMHVNESSMTFDTNPYNNPDDSIGMLNKGALLMNFLENYLGIGSDVIFNMQHTSAMDGRQTATSGSYEVTWKYHPNTGLEGTVTVK